MSLNIDSKPAAEKLISMNGQNDEGLA